MAAWILKLLLPIAIDLAVKYGVPALLEKLPFIPKALVDDLVALVKRAIEEMTGYHPTSPEGLAVRRLAKQEAKQCIGAFCAPQTKGLD